MSPKQDSYYSVFRCMFGHGHMGDIYFFRIINQKIMLDDYHERVAGAPHWWPIKVG